MSDEGPELGVCLAAFADRTLDEALDAVAGLDLRVVDLPTDTPFPLTASLGSPAELAARLDDAGLRVACVSNSRDAQLLLGPHGELARGVLTGSPAAQRGHALSACAAAIDLAAVVGAPLVRLMIGCPDVARWLSWPASGVSWTDNVEAFAEAAAPLARAARERKVTLVVEPHVKQVPFDARSVLDCVAALGKVGEDLGICFDPANVAALGFDPVDFLDAIELVPRCVHVKDLERSSGALAPDGPGWKRYGPHPAIRFRAVPWGELDWPRILTRLHEIGFDGPLLVEHEDVLMSATTGIARTREHVRALQLTEPPRPAWW